MTRDTINQTRDGTVLFWKFGPHQRAPLRKWFMANIEPKSRAGSEVDGVVAVFGQFSLLLPEKIVFRMQDSKSPADGLAVPSGEWLCNILR